MGNTSADGVVNHLGEVFGYRNLFVADASIIPEALDVNPSRTIGHSPSALPGTLL
jgi:cholesterol oxidase